MPQQHTQEWTIDCIDYNHARLSSLPIRSSLSVCESLKNTRHKSSLARRLCTLSDDPSPSTISKDEKSDTIDHAPAKKEKKKTTTRVFGMFFFLLLLSCFREEKKEVKRTMELIRCVS